MPCVLSQSKCHRQCPSRQLQGLWQRTVGSEGDQPGQFNNPRGLTLTPDESLLLVVDGGNRRVAVLRASDGTWVRQLTGPPGTLGYPIGVAVVPSTGEVLVSDWDRHQVVRFRSIDDDTVVATLGPGPEFDEPSGLALLDGPNCPLVCCLHFSLSTTYTQMLSHGIFLTRYGPHRAVLLS
jgi:hypothetical protein